MKPERFAMTLKIHIIEDDCITLCELDPYEEQPLRKYIRAEFSVTDCEVELDRRVI